MKEAVFIDSWLMLNKKSRKRFSLFVESPYFNKRAILSVALEYIENYKQLNDASKFKRDLFELLFPEQPYQDGKVRHILSDLTALLKKFIPIEFNQNTKIQRQYELSKVVDSLRMEALFKKEWNNLKQTVAEPLHHNSTTQLYIYKYHFEAQSLRAIRSREGYEYLQDATFNLEAYFIAESLKLASLNSGPQSVSDISNAQRLLKNALTYVDAGIFDQSPAVIIYFYAYKMLVEKDENYYFKFAAFLNDNWELFPLYEVEDIYLMGINFCISKINIGDRAYMKHAFDLYRSGLDKKVFMKDGFLSIHNYKNILRLGLTQKAYEWTEAFLHEFKEWLPKLERENTYVYNLAYFYFNQLDYDKTMDLLRQVKFTDVYNNLDARRMLLRIYFEKEEWSALDSHLDSFQSFVMRQKNIGYHKVANLNLVKISRLLMNKFPLTEKGRAQIQKRINNATHLAEKNWVLLKAGL